LKTIKFFVTADLLINVCHFQKMQSMFFCSCHILLSLNKSIKERSKIVVVAVAAVVRVVVAVVDVVRCHVVIGRSGGGHR